MTAQTIVETRGSTPTFVATSDEHDDAVTLVFRGVSVTITLRSVEHAERFETDPNTVLVLIDTDPEVDALPLAVHVNDDDTFEGVIR